MKIKIKLNDISIILTPELICNSMSLNDLKKFRNIINLHLDNNDNKNYCHQCDFPAEAGHDADCPFEK